MMNAPPISDASLRDFVAWAVMTLGGRIDDTERGWVFAFDENADRPPLDGPIDPSDLARHPGLVRLLAQRLSRCEPLPCAVPRADVQRVSELASYLYRPYCVDGGTVRLAGCTLENRFFFRVTNIEASDAFVSVSHDWFDDEGNRVDRELREMLGLEELVYPPRPIPRQAIPRVPDGLGRGKADGTNAKSELVVAAVAVKWATGKLEFVHESRSVFVEFSGWAQALRKDPSLLPPYVCPETGRQGYHLLRTATGELTVREAVGQCAVSGEWHLLTNLGTCVVSGLQVARELLEVCPISQELLLPQELTRCQMCGEPVSPLVIAGRRCRACRQMESVANDDPHITTFAQAFPEARTLSRWKVAETDTTLIAIGTRWWREWLFVVDRSSLALRRLARRRRWQRHWQPVQGDWPTTE